MGVADVIPGVSGGTMALITGIYEELVQTLAGLTPRLLMVWYREGFRAFWQRGNFSFLAVLMAGIFTAIVLFARIFLHLLETWPILVWSFFFGLILASIWLVLRPLGGLNATRWLALFAGVLVAGWLSISPGLTGLGLTPMAFFLSGAVAICAMILPGISGAFILLLLGMYVPLMEAVHDRQWVILVAFLFGCGCGLLAFVHVLRWLLVRFYRPVMALLAGFMAGSLAKLWPWRVPVEGVAVLEKNLLPGVWAEQTGQSPMVFGALLAASAGVVLVSLLSLHNPVHNGS